MRLNKQAYDAAFQRAASGKSPNGLWNLVRSPFEDEYTRQAREQGERDGLAARQTPAAESVTPPSAT